MKFLLPALLAVAIAFTAMALWFGRGQTAPPDPTGYDLDGDGYVTILDLTILANHFLEPVPVNGCVTYVYYSTPINQVDAAGTVVGSYSQGVIIPADHPVLAGTQAALRPC